MLISNNMATTAVGNIARIISAIDEGHTFNMPIDMCVSRLSPKTKQTVARCRSRAPRRTAQIHRMPKTSSSGAPCRIAMRLPDDRRRPPRPAAHGKGYRSGMVWRATGHNGTRDNSDGGEEPLAGPKRAGPSVAGKMEPKMGFN